MRVISADQSLSKFAYIVWEGNKVLQKGIIRTGNSGVKTKKKDVNYFDTTEEQVLFICEEFQKVCEEHKPSIIVLEGLSFGSVGTATRDLAGLFYSLKLYYKMLELLEFNQWIAYAPTSIKSLARESLDEEKQTEISSKTGKPKKVKMDKKLMVEAAINHLGEEFFKGLNYSNGKDDLADAFWLGMKYLKESSKEEK